MVQYKSLENTSLEEIHKTFIEAFSDYEVDMNLPFDTFKGLLRRRGYDASVSIGAFDDEKLVGFLLDGFREWNGKMYAYDTGTAIFREYRNKGITTEMFERNMELLREKDASGYILEVLKGNESAIHLYKKQGFNVVREFDCFVLKDKNIKREDKFKTVSVDGINDIEWKNFERFWDFKPSWQNSIDSVKADKNTFEYSVVVLDDRVVGYGIMDLSTGDILQIAVDKDFRKRGIAKEIVAYFLDKSKIGSVKVSNVESTCKSMEEFLKKIGFEFTVSQYEMEFII